MMITKEMPGKDRSEIHPQYASRFIRQFVIDTNIPTDESEE